MSSDQDKTNSIAGWTLSIVVIIACIALASIGGDNSWIGRLFGSSDSEEITCVDVTSYDHNWNNDWRCTRPDGSQFYTSYSGAAEYGH